MQSNSRDFSTFSVAELKESAKLLIMYRSHRDKTRLLGYPVSVEKNPESNTVFLIDENFHSAVIHNEVLEDWLICGCLREGYRTQMFANGGCCRQLAIMNSDSSAA